VSDQDEMDFGVYATTACNHARRRNSPPVPDQDGFFDAAGVVVICGRRQCDVEFSGEFAATVARDADDKKIPLTAIAPGRWDPVSILSACTISHNNRVSKVNPHKARFTNPSGLDELKIASIVGADGVVPYRLRGFAYVGPKAGDATYAFEQIVFAEQKNTGNYSVRRALRALEDVGLVSIKLGSRGGMATAKFTWTPLAYLPAPTLRQTPTAYDDELALEALAMGVA
jgi:hypothetical protein